MTAAGCFGGTPWDVRPLQPPVTRESLVQRVSQIRFFPHGSCGLPLRLRRPQHPAPSVQLSGSVTHAELFEFAIFYMIRRQSRWAQRVPSDPGPCHACRDEGGHLVAHLGQGLGSCISARRANKATVGPVPCHVVMMHWMPLQIWTRARSWSGTMLRTNDDTREACDDHSAYFMQYDSAETEISIYRWPERKDRGAGWSYL